MGCLDTGHDTRPFVIGDNPPAILLVEAVETIRVADFPMEARVLQRAMLLRAKQMAGRADPHQFAGNRDRRSCGDVGACQQWNAERRDQESIH